MQTQQHHDISGGQLEHYDGNENAAGSRQQASDNGANEGELQRYEDEEIVTKPWPPLQ